MITATTATPARGSTIAPPRDGWLAYMARHGRSFRFAARFMRAADRDRVAAV